jgi:hypothetical protein
MDKAKILKLAANHPFVVKALDHADQLPVDDSGKLLQLIALILQFATPHPEHPDRITIKELVALLKLVLALIEMAGLPPETEVPVPTPMPA